MILTLPWPPKVLSPNDRPHWAKLARAKKAYRHACAWTAKSQGATQVDAERLQVHLTFVPPDRRSRDDQNLIAAMKSGLDGIADVIGVDDSKWYVTHEPYSTEKTGGFVKVEIRL